MISINSDILYINEEEKYNKERFKDFDIVVMTTKDNKINILKDKYGHLQNPSHPANKKTNIDFSKIEVCDFIRTKSFIGCVTAVMNKGFAELLIVNGYSYKTDTVYNDVIFKNNHHNIIEHIPLDEIDTEVGPSYERVKSSLVLGAYAKGFKDTTILSHDSVQHDLNPSTVGGLIGHPSRAALFINKYDREIVLDSRKGRGYIYRNGVYASISK